ncbi:MAG: precorrin-6y C5,15-methyltransferase (decarboxylating) subunit CbiE [Acidimicrobiales bacterium]
MREEPQRRITVVGMVVGSDGLTKEAVRAVEAADLVVGGRRHLEAWSHLASRQVTIEGDIGPALDAVASEPGPVCVLASGDPGFFGITRALAERFGAASLTVHPTTSSVALAFARVGLSWDDALVASAHGRPLADAVRQVAAAPKAAVLTSPENPPEAVGRALSELGVGYRSVAVASRLGLEGETVTTTDLAGLGAGTWDPLSVVVLLGGNSHESAGCAGEKTLAWGLPEAGFAHRQGMITKAEVRAVVLGKLALPRVGVVWDVGAGSGSVAVECALLAPALRVMAVDRDPEAVATVAANATAHGVTVEVVAGDAPDALSWLPDPDRVFVGGGGLDVLDAVLARLRPGGRVVATYAALDRAAAAYRRLGNLAQVSVSRGCALPGGGVRLAAENPVLVAWGPGSEQTP